MTTPIEPALRKIRVNGIELAYFERNAPRPDRPSLLFVHCTGFHARVWDRIVEAFPGHHVLALDQRGHGRSEKQLITHWKVFGEDMAALLDALDLRRVVGVGHSMGGHAMVDAGAKGGAFARMILCDPTIAEPDAYGKPPPFLDAGGVHPAARRSRRFASPEDMLEKLRDKGSYPLFDPRMLWDYCRYGLLPTESGEYTLACPPEVEASVYMTSRTNDGIYDSVRALDVPVLVIRAKLPPAERQPFDFASSPTWPGLAGAFPRGREIYLADCTHFVPMQMPRLVVEAVQREIAAWEPG